MATTESAGRGRRVLIIVENLPVPFDRRVWQEATTLRRHGYQVTVLCPRMKGFLAPREVIDGVHIYRHPLPREARSFGGYLIEYPVATFWQLVYAARIFFERGFDAIHACNPPDTIFLVAGLFKLMARSRFLFDHHDLCPELYEAKFGRRRLGWRLLRLLEHLTFRIADVSIATNESYREIALTRGAMPPDRVFVVRSGPDLSRIRAVPIEPQWRNGRRFLVGYVGTMGRQEGIPYLLEAARILVQERGRADIQFCLVGGGPEQESLRATSFALGVSDFVTFTGRAPDDVLLGVISTADLCVNPDEWNEMNDKSTMNKIMEYMALGKPILQFELKEGRFSAQDASAYAKPNDARSLADEIESLLADPRRRETMGRRGLVRVNEALSWDHSVPHLLRAYEKLLGASGDRPPVAVAPTEERRETAGSG